MPFQTFSIKNCPQTKTRVGPLELNCLSRSYRFFFFTPLLNVNTVLTKQPIICRSSLLPFQNIR